MVKTAICSLAHSQDICCVGGQDICCVSSQENFNINYNIRPLNEIDDTAGVDEIEIPAVAANAAAYLAADTSDGLTTTAASADKAASGSLHPANTFGFPANAVSAVFLCK